LGAVAATAGTLALLGGGEWHPACRPLDEALLASSGGTDVVVLAAAAAFEHPDRVVDHARTWFGELGAKVEALPVTNRRDAEQDAVVRTAAKARFLYIADGSPLHLRSVLKGSELFDAMVSAYRSGAVLAASGAGATLLCDPMVDPRGGAYTVGLGIVRGLAVFPYHGDAADHLRERSIELLPAEAALVGLDAHTALVRNGSDDWKVAGPGHATVYRRGRDAEVFDDGATVTQVPR
jgi:cyanophycinase